ncbi:MAG: hypothetical protein NTV97_13240 [Alphaproteobacteria bacterium]|nr:hypothetical protein [Alphaproteobacteria bacterium]
MVGEPFDLVLEHLRAIRSECSEIRQDLRDLKTRQNDTHMAVLALRRDQAQDAEIVAHQRVQMDRLREEIDRIKVRLDLRDG